jgi:hypothetical protein
MDPKIPDQFKTCRFNRSDLEKLFLYLRSASLDETLALHEDLIRLIGVESSPETLKRTFEASNWGYLKTETALLDRWLIEDLAGLKSVLRCLAQLSQSPKVAAKMSKQPEFVDNILVGVRLNASNSEIQSLGIKILVALVPNNPNLLKKLLAEGILDSVVSNWPQEKASKVLLVDFFELFLSDESSLNRISGATKKIIDDFRTFQDLKTEGKYLEFFENAMSNPKVNKDEFLRKASAEGLSEGVVEKLERVIQKQASLSGPEEKKFAESGLRVLERLQAAKIDIPVDLTKTSDGKKLRFKDSGVTFCFPNMREALEETKDETKEGFRGA